MSWFRHLSFLVPLALMVGPAHALDADGPDTFRVVGVSAGGNLNLREGPSTNTRVVGKIPSNADGLVNLGCEGGMTYGEWESATEQERAMASDARWCKVRFGTIEGYVAGRFLAEGTGTAPRPAAEGPPPTPAPTDAPAFDCAKAEGDVQEQICASPRLAELDQEVTRLYLLASRDPDITDERKRSLIAMQRGWIKGRDECWKAATDLDTCVENQYALRIDELRTLYPATRKGEGISTGPVSYQCTGFDPILSATYISGQSMMALLKWEDRNATLFGVPSASGAKYQSDAMADLNFDGAPEDATVLWTKGDEATFSFIGSSDMPCRKVAGG